MESANQRTPELTGAPQFWSYPSAPQGLSTFHSIRQYFESAPPLASDAFRVERLLATSRLLLALGTLLTFAYAATMTGATATALIVGFTIYSAIAWNALRVPSLATGRLPISLHV